MEKTLTELQEKIEVLQTKHDEDIELSHTLGSDSYCLYCEQYKKLMKQQESLFKKIGKNSAAAKKYTAKTVKEKTLFEISLTDASKYLVYAADMDEALILLKIPMNKVHKHTTIPTKYWNDFYIETYNGTLTTVRQIITTRRSRVVSTYSLSKNPEVRHYCFNETPFQYLFYNSKRLELLEKFVRPYPVIQTKKFKSTGRVAIQLPTGTIGIDHGELLLKITDKVIVVIEEEDFKKNFSEQENHVWTAK